MKTSKSVKVYLQMGYPIALAHHKAKNQVKHFHKSQKKEEKDLFSRGIVISARRD